MAIGRSLRDVVIIDAGEPRNVPAEGAHNVLGNEGISPVERLEVEGTQVRSVALVAGRSFPADAAVVVPRFHARTEHFQELGGATEQTDFGPRIPSDERGMTEVPGVWAAGSGA